MSEPRKNDVDTAAAPGVDRSGARPDEQETASLPAPDSTAGDPRRSTGGPSLARASGTMAVASLFSKVTGLARSLVIAWVLGLSVEADAYNAANTLPNQVFELLVGGVLTSVLVPVLARARQDDSDAGESYTQRLLTMTSVVLVVVTALAVLAAPALTALVLDESTGRANSPLTTAFAYLLLPQILFYGLSALLTAVLNARHVFGPAVWAPVVNNLVLLATFGTYALLPGEMSMNPVRMDDAHLLVLGLGSTTGVLVQAAVLLPFLLRSGFRFRWRWGWDARFAEFGGMALWTIGYALAAQLGVLAVTNVASASGGLAIYNSVWLLVQLPYGVIGFSLITAILPRMSRAAGRGDTDRVKGDLSLANRLSVVAMLPMSALLTVLGPSLGTALYAVGQGSEEAPRLGGALAVAAFGALPYAFTLVQLRVFYALKDARTPTLIMGIMLVVKVPLSYLAGAVLDADHVVHGLTFANSLSFVAGWLVGMRWLRSRLGVADRARQLTTFGKALIASAVAAGVALVVRWALPDHTGGAWLALLVGGLGGMVIAMTVLALLGTREVRPLADRLLRRPRAT